LGGRLLDDSAVTESHGLFNNRNAAGAIYEQVPAAMHQVRTRAAAAALGGRSRSKKHVAGGDFVLWQVPTARVN
jgi:hypothetical protein